jgi:hypothetical protein
MDSTPLDPTAPAARKWTLFWRITVVALFGLFLARAIEASRDDFLAYYAAGTRALHGISPYLTEETPYRYLPVTAYVFVPFTLFSVSVARIVFFLLNFGATITIYAAIRNRLGNLATLLLAVFFFRFHNHDFGNSQINPMLLVLFFYWWKSREENIMLSTLAFSAFGSFKLLPFALGLPLAVHGRWREISWIGLWTVVLNFLPVFFYSTGPIVFKDWYTQLKGIDDPVMLSNIQSIQSALWWTLEGHVSHAAFMIAMRVFQAIFLLFVVIYAPKKNQEAWRIASILAITVLISPLAWKHNYLQFLPLGYLWFFEDPKFVEKRTRILYGISMVGMVILPTAFGAWNRGFADRLYFMPWTGVLVVILGILFARHAENSSNPTAGRSPPIRI